MPSELDFEQMALDPVLPPLDPAQATGDQARAESCNTLRRKRDEEVHQAGGNKKAIMRARSRYKEALNASKLQASDPTPTVASLLPHYRAPQPGSGLTVVTYDGVMRALHKTRKNVGDLIVAIDADYTSTLVVPSLAQSSQTIGFNVAASISRLPYAGASHTGRVRSVESMRRHAAMDPTLDPELFARDERESIAKELRDRK